MKDYFPQVRALLILDSYFDDFKNDDEEVKIYGENDAPTGEFHPFVTIEIRPNRKSRNTDWVNPDIIISATGPNEENEETGYKGMVTLFEICENAERIIRANNCLPIAAGNPLQQYETLGDSVWDKGENPVLEMVTASVGLTLGIAA